MLTTETKRFTLRNREHYTRFEGWCLSTDEKPTERVLNGSSLTEMDTGKLYFFDEESAQWLEFGG